MAGTVLTGVTAGVATLTLNRPERLNALNATLLADLCAALDHVLADDGVGALVLRGAGRAFCSGDDLKDIENQTAGEAKTRAFIEAIQEVSRRLVLGDKVVVGAIHGWAVGGGLEWAINCDLAVFGEGTKCFFPEIKWGMFPTGGRRDGDPAAHRGAGRRPASCSCSAKPSAPRKAHAMGLAWRVVAGRFGVSRRRTRRPRASPPCLKERLCELKRVLNRAGGFDIEGALALETEATVRRFLDPETAERVKSLRRLTSPVSRLPRRPHPLPCAAAKASRRPSPIAARRSAISRW